MNVRLFLALLVFSLLVQETALAQRGFIRQQIRRNIEKDMKEEHGETNRKRGKEELEKVTYENDTRYKDAFNKQQATISFEDITYDKRGNVKETLVSRIVFGKTGECMIMNEDTEDESWFIFNYADKANYICNPKNKTAIKMPLINMKKMAEKMANRGPDDAATNNDLQHWSETEEYKTINGFKCRKYVYTYEEDTKYQKLDAWITTEIKLDLSGNYLFGARLEDYKMAKNSDATGMYNGFLIRSILFNEKGMVVSQRDLKEFTLSADESYFDMSQFKVNDVLSEM